MNRIRFHWTAVVFSVLIRKQTVLNLPRTNVLESGTGEGSQSFLTRRTHSPYSSGEVYIPYSSSQLYPSGSSTICT